MGRAHPATWTNRQLRSHAVLSSARRERYLFTHTCTRRRFNLVITRFSQGPVSAFLGT